MTASVTSLIAQGKAAMLTENYMHALGLFSKALAQDKSNHEALLLLIQSQLLKGELLRARPLIEMAVGTTPDDPKAHVVKATWYMGMKDYNKALVELKKAGDLDPLSFEVYYNRGVCHYAKNEMNQATRAFLQALSLNTKCASLYMYFAKLMFLAGNPAGAMITLCMSVCSDMGFIPGYLELARNFGAKGDHEHVIWILELGLKVNSGNEDLQARLSMAYLRAGKIDKAVEAAKELTELRDYYGDYLRLGEMALKKPDLNQAEVFFKKAIELEPKAWICYYNLALLHELQNNFDEAIKNYEGAINHGAGRDLRPYNNIARLYLIKEQHDDAERALMVALGINVNHPDVNLNMALCMVAKNESDKAGEYIAKVERFADKKSANYLQAMALKKSLQK